VSYWGGGKDGKSRLIEGERCLAERRKGRTRESKKKGVYRKQDERIRWSLKENAPFEGKSAKQRRIY